MLLVFVISFLLISCRVSRQEIQKSDTQIETTSEKVVSYKDTTLYAPKAETALKIPLSDLVFKNQLNTNSKPIVYSQKNAQANVKLKIVRDTIVVEAICDSLALVAKIKSELLKQSTDRKEKHDAEITTQTGYTFYNLIQAFIAGIIFWFIVGLILLIVNIFKKKKP